MKCAKLLFLAPLLSGCSFLFPQNAPPEKTAGTSNSAIKIDQLFTDKNGCTIYRFFDQGDFRYYLVGPAGSHMLPSTTHIADTVTETIDTGTSGGGGGHGDHKK